MSIHLVLGCMMAAKSTELLRRIRRYQFGGKTTFLIKYGKDNRYNTNSDKLSTHDEIKVNCDYSTEGKLMDDSKLLNKIQNVDVIGIDEGQFYPDIDIFAEHFANLGKIIIISALDSDYKRRPFGKILELISKAEEYVKLTAVCKCGSDAAFTKRISNETEDIIIGGKDKYIAVCRKCYFSK
jgi:thymidine kinase